MYLAFENLGGEEFDFEAGEEIVAVEAKVVGGENGGGDLPSGVVLLELDEPLVGGNPIAGFRVVVENVNCLSYLDL